MLWKFTAKLFYEYNLENPKMAFFNIIFIIMFPIINYIICMIQKAFLNHEINKYLPVVSNYCTIILRNIIWKKHKLLKFTSITPVKSLRSMKMTES